MSDFRAWFGENLGDYAEDIASHGCDAGFPYITYTSDAVEVYEAHEAEIWEALNDDAEGMGYDNVTAMIATFGRSDMANDPDQLKNLLCWYMCEKVAHEISG